MIKKLKKNTPHPCTTTEIIAKLIPTGKHLFINEQLIESKKSVFCRVNQPTKNAKALLEPERKYEGQCLCFGSVIEMPDKSCRLYYRGWSQEDINPLLSFRDDAREFKKKYGYGRAPICIAEATEDSITRIDFADSVIENTNVVMDETTLDDFSIMYDENAQNPNERYKMLASYDNIPNGLSAASSKDGIKWEWKRKNAVSYFGDRCSFWYNPLHKTYVAWSRSQQIYMHRRWIFQQETTDFPNWQTKEASTDTCIGYTENLHCTPQLVLHPDNLDNADLQFYSGYPFYWGNMFLAYIECYHVDSQKLNVQLAGSYDGWIWFRIGDRATFMECGNHHDFDAYWIVPTYNPPILRDGKMLIYYNGRPDPHKSPNFKHIAPGMRGSFGVSTLREDGFASLDATGEIGVVKTKLLTTNTDIKSFSVNCMPFRENASEMPMSVKIKVFNQRNEFCMGWHISALDGKTIWYDCPIDCEFPQEFHLEFELQNCRLYSFKIEEKHLINKKGKV